MIYHHIYNRGAHKVPIFNDRSDYWRMLRLLYIANCSKPFNIRDIGESKIFDVEREDKLVDIVAYCLMPNHIHIALSETLPMSDIGDRMSDIGKASNITKFMRKVCTGYSNYFNLKYIHSGTIWQNSYKEKLFDKKDLGILVPYVHLNPYGIKEPDMTKEARKEHPEEAWAYSKEYEFSSLKDYLGEDRIQKNILSFPLPDLPYV